VRAISRGIDSVKELKRVEQEEAKREQRRLKVSGSSAGHSSTKNVLDPDFIQS
jgi:hypothetical protein